MTQASHGEPLAMTDASGAQWYSTDGANWHASPETARSGTERPGRLLVTDETTGGMVLVTPAEAARGLLRYARSLGPGTAACGAWEQRALEIARG